MKLAYFVLLAMLITISARKPKNKAKKAKKAMHVHHPLINHVIGSHAHIHPIRRLIHSNRGSFHHPNHFYHSHGVHSHLTHQATPISYYHASANNYINIARLAYCPKKLILAKRCSVCHFALNQHKTFFVHTVNENKKRLFQFVIVYSVKKKEILITFSGPTTTQPKYFNKVYKKGFTKAKELGKNIQVENYYWEIYSRYIRKVLHKKMIKILKSKRSHYKVVFIGHSFGGSIATLAAFDLVHNNIISKEINSPIVYTYGQLRIGDNSFVSAANKLIKVIRIMRSDDFVTRVPSCVYDKTAGLFKCYPRVASILQHFPIFRKYFVIYRRGVRLYRKTIIKRFRATKTMKVHYHSYFTQPLGTIVYYNGNNFGNYHACGFKNGVPSCEDKIKLPPTFSPSIHRFYYGVNVEDCH